jgi:hypothetical protein
MSEGTHETLFVLPVTVVDAIDAVAPLASALHETALSPAFVHLIPRALCLLLPLALPRPNFRLIAEARSA